MLKAQIAIDAGVGLEDKGEPVDVDDDSGDVTMEEAGEAGETRQLDETEVTAEPGEAGESAEANETEQQEAENREEQRQENGVDGTQGDAADTLMEGTQDGGADTLMEDDLDGPVDQPPGYNSDSPPPRYEDVFETEDEEVQWAENGTPPHRSVEPSEDADDLGNGENSDNTSDAPGGPNPGHTASLLEGSWDEEMDGIPASPPPRRDLPHLFGLDSGAGRTPDNPIRIWWDHHHHNLYP